MKAKRKKAKTNRYLSRVCKDFGIADVNFAIEALLRQFRDADASLESIASILRVAKIAGEPLPVDGIIVFDDQNQPVIKINSTCSHERKRFTLGHEIGHLILQTVFDGATSCQRDLELETACDAIAAELLMPVRALTPYVLNLGDPSTENLVRIAKKFQVSLRATACRIHRDLKLWPHPIGFWQFDDGSSGANSDPGATPGDCPHERWFVGKRSWKTRTPPFKVFTDALDAMGPVRRSGTYFDVEENVAKHLSLEVLHLGGKRLLGIVL